MGMLFNQMLLEEEDRLKKLEAELEKKLEKAPEGSLNAYRHGKSWRWYNRSNKEGKVTREYIQLNKSEYLMRLANKEANMRQLKDARQELEAIRQYKSVYERGHQKGRFMLKTRFDRLKAESPGIWFLLQGKEEQAWLAEEYIQKSGFEEQKRYPSNNGLFTRSKSESIIASVLEEVQIPFRYEERIVVGNYTVHPDFTLRHPRSGKIVYWEHFGMMDDGSYKSETARKLNQYIAMGIVPGINMLASFEMKEVPMSFTKAKAYVEYFLDHMG